jgi:DNA-nicking Smr family endonuclease
MGRRRQEGKGHAPRKATPRGELRPEDAALWNAFTQGIEQARFRPRVPETDVSSDAVRSSSGEARAVDGSRAAKAARSRGGAEIDRTPRRKQQAAAAKPATVSNMIDSKAVRRIGNGRVAIDARVDLHGLRQSEAHAELRRFLMRSVAKGHRMVLVITGKGGRDRARIPAVDSDDFRADGFGFAADREPGVLRRQVPMWLREPDLAAIVVGFTTAHIRHGGEGALYVQLRRAR